MYVGKQETHVSRQRSGQAYLYGFGNVANAKSGRTKSIPADTRRA